MSKLYPSLMVHRVYDITPEMLGEMGIRALILDVDNTLTTHNNPDLEPQVRQWLDLMRENGINMVILSNNNPGRIQPFAQAVGLPYIADALKPLRRGFWRAAEQLGAPLTETAAVGDQIFTDILGANLARVKSFLVEPMEPEAAWFFRLKRRLEIPIIRRCKRKGRESV